MHPLLRLVGLVAVFLFTTVCWFALAGVTSSRTQEQQYALDGRVADLWGSPQAQLAPAFIEEWVVERQEASEVTDPVTGRTMKTSKTVRELQSRPVDPNRSRIAVDLKLDQRRKGLLWYPLYDVGFSGDWTYRHEGRDDHLRIVFPFADSQGVYDDFAFVVDGVDRARELHPEGGKVYTVVPVTAGQVVSLHIGYTSRGKGEWSYRPTEGVGQIEDFSLVMNTDFDSIDYPNLTLSPSSRTATEAGWRLEWTFSRLVSAYGIGMVMPERVQPGELSSSISLSAPLSLGLYFLWIYVLGILKGKSIHPINYLFIAAAFFSFDLLFAYTADRLPVEQAFALASVVSIGLVASYLRLVVGSRFALFEAGLAQLLYQVGFSLAHFWEGTTGLTITVLGTVTLFALMQLTGRIKWSEVLSRQAPAAPLPSPAR